MESEESVSVEEVVRNSLDGLVGISYIMRRTGLTEGEVDSRLRKMHEEGVITYSAAIQKSGEKVAKWNYPHEEP